MAVAPLCGRIGMRPTIALDVIHARCAPLQQCHCCTLMNTASRPLRSVPAAEQQRDGGRCEAGLRLYRHRPGRLSGVAAWAQLQAWENLSAPHRLAIEPHVFSTAVAAPLLTSAIWQLHWHFAPQIADLLDRMALTAEAAADGGTVRVLVPPTRSDVLHACDVFEVRAASHHDPRRLSPMYEQLWIWRELQLLLTHAMWSCDIGMHMLQEAAVTAPAVGASGISLFGPLLR